MLYQRLLLLFPQAAPGISGVWYLVLVAAGLALMVAGSRLGQATITLGLVTIGALIGKVLPALTGLHLDPMATTVGVAFAAGVFGFLSHRWITGLGFSLLAVLWTALGFWMLASSPSNWTWPPYPGGAGHFLDYLKILKSQLGPELSGQIAPFGVDAFIASLALYTMLPKLATAMFWVMSGVTIAVLSLLAYAEYANPALLARFPATLQGQTLVVGLLLLAGMLCQVIAKQQPAPSGPPPLPSSIQPAV